MKYVDGDPWAVDALSIWDRSNPNLTWGQKTLAAINMFRLKNELWSRDWFMKPRSSYTGELYIIGLQISGAYVDQVDRNYGYVPTIPQMNHIHYLIFNSHNLSSTTYGATPFGYGQDGFMKLWGDAQSDIINDTFHYCSPRCVP